PASIELPETRLVSDLADQDHRSAGTGGSCGGGGPGGVGTTRAIAANDPRSVGSWRVVDGPGPWPTRPQLSIHRSWASCPHILSLTRVNDCEISEIRAVEQ